jgi:hypothetical protein
MRGELGRGNKINYQCPYCYHVERRDGYIFTQSWTPCGLSDGEHKRLIRAVRRARRQAREMSLQELERAQLPREMIAELYRRAEAEVRRLAR